MEGQRRRLQPIGGCERRPGLLDLFRPEAELRVGAAGLQGRVGAGPDTRADAEPDPDGDTRAPLGRLDGGLHFVHRLEDDQVQAAANSLRNGFGRFGNAPEDDSVRRHACRQGAGHLAYGGRLEADAVRGEPGQDAEVVVGLHRITDVRRISNGLDPAPYTGVEDSSVVHVDGCAQVADDFG